MKNMHMHLTNYSLNKKSEKFKEAGQDFADVNSTASKQLLTNLFKKLSSLKGEQADELKSEIEKLAQRTVIALEPYLKNAYHCFISPTADDNPRCFQVLGLDILVDESMKPWLMEVNANPSLNWNGERENI